ncbi:MAG: hypothetical protein IIZ29_04150 [Schwartzia sp.]|nr:hypothetical protein [Schwartzia sp. (in: firmicutes)]
MEKKRKSQCRIRMRDESRKEDGKVKFKDLIMTEFINDDTEFTITRVISRGWKRGRNGKWCNDHILDLAEFDVYKFEYNSILNTVFVMLDMTKLEEQQGKDVEAD